MAAHVLVPLNHFNFLISHTESLRGIRANLSYNSSQARKQKSLFFVSSVAECVLTMPRFSPLSLMCPSEKN